MTKKKVWIRFCVEGVMPVETVCDYVGIQNTTVLQLGYDSNVRNGYKVTNFPLIHILQYDIENIEE